MTPAEQRVRELVDKWLKSLELHLKYASLDDEAYWRVQPWVPHQRPARWILELAHARASDLNHQLQARGAAGDAGFAEAVELMAFLSNLVGAQPLERFVPLAEASRENAAALVPRSAPLADSGDVAAPPVAAEPADPVDTTTEADVVVEIEDEWADAESIELGGDVDVTDDVVDGTDDADDADGTEPTDGTEIDDSGDAVDADLAEVAGETDEAAESDASDASDASEVAEGYEVSDEADEADESEEVDEADVTDDVDPGHALDTGAGVDEIAPEAVPHAAAHVAEDRPPAAVVAPARTAASAAAPAFGSVAMPTLTMTVTINPMLNGGFGSAAAWRPSAAPDAAPVAVAPLPPPVEAAPPSAPDRSDATDGPGDAPHPAASAPAAASPEAATGDDRAEHPAAPPATADAPAASVVGTPAEPPAPADAAPPAIIEPATAPSPGIAASAAAIAPPSARAEDRTIAPSSGPGAATAATAQVAPPTAPRIALPPTAPHVGSPPLTLAALEARIATPRSPPRAAAAQSTPRATVFVAPPTSAAPARAAAPPPAPPAPRPTSVWVSETTVEPPSRPPAPPAVPATPAPTAAAPPLPLAAVVETPPWNEDTRRSLALRAGVAPAVAGARRADDVPVLDAPRAPPGKGRKETRPAKAGSREPTVESTTDEVVIADAVRLLKWGKEWHELAEAIARMAGRPAVGEIRRLLKSHKADIQKQARH